MKECSNRRFTCSSGVWMSSCSKMVVSLCSALSKS